TEFAEEVCKILGVKAEFLAIEWGAKVTELKAGNIDTIWNGMTALPELEAEIALSAHYMKNRPVIVARAEDADKYKTAEGIAGAAISDIGVPACKSAKNRSVSSS
ncbi:MAG: transporter substrate-binding domain-containing protein, partial [Clostridia bacterium]|nr:transporter substrate-binding domain-containing protein [Clostridia bacterium]